MARAEYPVPPGFCATTAAYHEISLRAGLEPILASLASVESTDLATLNDHAARAREAVP